MFQLSGWHGCHKDRDEPPGNLSQGWLKDRGQVVFMGKASKAKRGPPKCLVLASDCAGLEPLTATCEPLGLFLSARYMLIQTVNSSYHDLPN